MIIAVCLLGISAPIIAADAQSYRQAKRKNRADTQDVDDRMGRTIAAVTAAESRKRSAIVALMN